MVSYLYQPVTGVSRTAVKTWARMWLLLRQTAMAVLACVWLSPSIASIAADSLDEARAAYQQQKYEQALKLLDTVIGNGVGPPGALELRIRTYLKLGQTDKAVEDYLRWADRRGADDIVLLRELTIQVIAAAVTDMREQMRGAALVALGRSEALPGVLELVKHPNPDERASVLNILGHLKDNRVVPSLFGALSDREATVRATAAGILAERKEAGAAKALIPLLKDPTPLVRGVAATGLTKLQGAKAVPLVEPLLQETVPAVRAEVAAALLPFNPASADPVLREAMNSPDPGVRSTVAKHLGQAGNQAVPYLLDLLHDQTPRPRISAIRALGHVGNEKNVAVLKPILSDPDVAVRVTAAGAIGRLLNGL